MVTRLSVYIVSGVSMLNALTNYSAGQAATQPDACAKDYVWREAFTGDHVCVSPGTREQAQSDNANAAQRRVKRDSEECIQGFVWRLAKPDDHVCVPQMTREQTAQDNQLAYSRLASGPPEGYRPGKRYAVPLPPAKIGCHVFKEGEWREVPCATREEMKRLPPPVALSIKDSQRFVKVGKDAYYPFTLPLQLGEIDIELDSDPALGTVTDVLSPGACTKVTSTIKTPDSFSIQLNTNIFTTSNGNTGWVQFVDQTNMDPKVPNKDALCVWQVDVTVADATKNDQGYEKACVYPERSRTFLGPELAGIGGQIAAVKGLIRVNELGFTVLTAWAQLPWGGPSYSAAVTAVDRLGLKGNWTQVSGGIYGTGCGSQAAFTGVRVTERVIASTCITYPYCSSLTPMTQFSLPNFAAPVYLVPGPRSAKTDTTGETRDLLLTLPTVVPLGGGGPKSFYCPYSEVCELVGQFHSPK